MLKRFLTYLVIFPLSVALIALGVVNAHKVDLILDPFRPDSPALSITLPFYAYLFAAIVTGVIIGSFATWRSQSHWRREARRRTAEAQRWHGEADRLARERDAMVREQSLTASSPGAPGGGLKQIAGGVR